MCYIVSIVIVEAFYTVGSATGRHPPAEMVLIGNFSN